MNKMSMPESNKKKSLDAIRVYAPSRGSLALDSEALPYTRVAEPAPAAAPRRPKLVPLAPAKKRHTLLDTMREYKVLPKTAAVVCILAMAFALIFTLSGFNNISASQKEINKLSKQVSEMEKNVEKANVDLLFSLDLASAHEAARDAGMSYPGTGNAGN